MSLRVEHVITRNEASTSPNWIITLDTEGHTARVPEGELDTFRLAVASWTDRGKRARGREQSLTETFTTPETVWRWVNDRCRHGRTTWLVAHGLHYDYPTSAAHRWLPALGWTYVAGNDRYGARWHKWRKGTTRLILVDSGNFLPGTVEDLGAAVGLPKRTMPHQRARFRTWERYCVRDVEIVHQAVLRLLDWWDAEDLGRFGLTAASCALAAFRHRFLPPGGIHRHADDRARALERDALFGGRREVYRHGRLPEGPWPELDYQAHYLFTAMECNVPVRLQQVGARIAPGLLDRVKPPNGVIARVTVDMDRPAVPWRHPELGIVYPTGTFTTTLCQPELELAAEHGRIVAWHEAAVYRIGEVFTEWAEWLLPLVDERGSTAPRLVRPMLKHWTRSLIGKFGARIPEADPTADDAGIVRYPDLEVTEHSQDTDLPWTGGPPLDPQRGTDAYNAVPAIMAWVHSAARVTLWRAMEAAGRDAVAYCDTDGMRVLATKANIVALATLCPDIEPQAPSIRAALPQPTRPRRRPTIEQRRQVARPKVPEPLAPAPVPGRMRLKDLASVVTIHRPQDYELDGREVIKGLPRERKKVGPRTYDATYWPGVRWQMAHARPGTYLRPVRTVHLTEVYDRGWVLDDGTVRPLEVRVEGRATVVVPWARTSYRKAGLRLQDPAQARRLPARARSPGP